MFFRLFQFPSAGALQASLPVAPPPLAVEVHGLTKVYRGGSSQSRRREDGGRRALEGIDLEIPRGALFGLLGPNGAGKSTLINILAGLVTRSAGHAAIWGYDIDRRARQARSAIGVVPQELNLDPFFSPRELLDLQAGLYGVPRRERRTEELLEAVGLGPQADAYARSLSGGMRRRLMVAKAMVHAPPVLVLDEPTAGVDVELRRQLWELVRTLNRQGTTVLLTTHYLEEAEQLCDTVAIINRGRVVACEATTMLVRRVDRKTVTLMVDRDVSEPPAALAALPIELGLGADQPRRLVINYRPSRLAMGAVLDAVRTAGLEIVDLSTEEADLEQIFLELTRDDDGRER